MTGSGFSGAVQTRNSDLVDLLRSDFQHRNEPNFAWKSVVSSFLALPLVRAFWPMSIVTDADPQARSALGGYHLTNNNVCTFGYSNLVTYVNFNGTTQSLTRADGGAADGAGLSVLIYAPFQLPYWGAYLSVFVFSVRAPSRLDTLPLPHDRSWRRVYWPFDSGVKDGPVGSSR